MAKVPNSIEDKEDKDKLKINLRRHWLFCAKTAQIGEVERVNCKAK